MPKEGLEGTETLCDKGAIELRNAFRFEADLSSIDTCLKSTIFSVTTLSKIDYVCDIFGAKPIQTGQTVLNGVTYPSYSCCKLLYCPSLILYKSHCS